MKILKFISAFIFILIASVCFADQEVISLFPLANYNQSVSTWIKPTSADYDKPLLSVDMQQKRLDTFINHYYGRLSPWSAAFVNGVLRQSAANNLKSIELSIINGFTNEGKTVNQIGYGENFRPYTKDWIEKITKNINVAQLDGLFYQSSNRGIAIDNLHARALPTDDPHFYLYKLAGQGYPFDNLQMSALWVGTPVYIITESTDHAWMLVLTPDYIGWVHSNGIARVDNAFISVWEKSARENLAAITHTQTAVVDESGKFLFYAYVGAVFPASYVPDGMRLMLPAIDADHRATIKHAIVSNEEAVQMPLVATPHHFANVINTMIGRPYGWGSMYFYNDCSAELKSLFTPFGIWLPRHSSDQVTVGKLVDMTTATQEKRLSYLKENGEPFLTLIYLGGHVVLYVGHDADKAMTYQNIWGLSPSLANRRAVIGQSVLFPMLLQYPEDNRLVSLANKKFFQVSYLSQLPNTTHASVGGLMDLRSLMYPEMLSYFVHN